MSPSASSSKISNELLEAFDRKLSGNTEQITELKIEKILLWDEIKKIKTDPVHIRSLVESISNQGLIEPLVVDRKHRLIAGRHRLEALHTLAKGDPARFARIFPNGKIPVAVLGFDAESDKILAVATMIAENQRRRMLGYDEFKRLHKLLEDLGYVTDKPGPTPTGETRISQVITHAFNITDRTYRRYVSQKKAEEKGNGPTPTQEPASLLEKIQKLMRQLSLAEYTQARTWLKSYVHKPPLLKDTPANQLKRRKAKHKAK